MRIIDTDKARKILIEREKVKPFFADLTLKNFPALDDSLAVAVDQWLENGEFTDVEIDGLTIKKVMQLRRSNFLVTVKDLNRLLDPMLTAETRRRLREILSKPVILE